MRQDKQEKADTDMDLAFTHPPSRAGTDSLKWEHYPAPSVIPLWVADMDFPAPHEVAEALATRAAHGVYGYTLAGRATAEAVCAWFHQHHGWHVDPDWIVWLPGLVTGLNVVCRAVGEVGDGVVAMPPVYPPFLSAPGLGRRERIDVPHVLRGGRWEMDQEKLARELAAHPRARLLLLCNPQNPTGRVYRQDELECVAELALRHDLMVCSDEVHCDLILEPEARHIPFASLAPEIAARTITLHSPSKTFNVPGLGCAYAIAESATLRQKLRGVMEGIVPYPNLFGYAGLRAAFTHGEPWRQELLAVLRQNRDAVAQAVRQMPGVSMIAPQATYLAWLDARGAGLEHPAKFFEDAGVGLSDGAVFGAPGFVRLNFGCAPTLLEEALRRMGAALRERSS